MNELLKRQIEKYFGDSKKFPKEFKLFLSAISEAYDGFDNDRKLIERSLDISSKELMGLNNSLIKERDFSKSIVDTAPTIILILDMEGRIVDFNPYMEELTGYSLAEVKGKDWFTNFLPKCDYNQIRKIFRKAIGNIHTKGNINPIVTKSGRKILVEWYDKALKDKNGKIIGLLSIGRDITELKKTEEALRESEVLSRSLMDANPMSIQGYGIDGIVRYWNKASEKIYGYSAKEAIGKNLSELILPPSIKPMFKQGLKLAKKADRSGEFLPAGEVQLRKKDGSSIDVYSTHVIVKIEGQEPEMFCIDFDLSERKKIEEELLKFKLGIERSDQAVFITDQKGLITYVNSTFMKLYGYKANQVLGKSRHILNSHKQTTRFYREFWRDLLKGKPMNVELTTRTKDGRYVNVMESVNPIIDDEKKIIGFLSIQTDITEEKKVQEKIIEAEERYRDIVENSPDMIHSVDKNGRVIFANKKERELLGYSESELLGISIKKIYAPELWREVEKGFKKLIQKGSLFVPSGKMIKKNGERIEVEVDSIAVYNKKGDFMYTRSIIRDITERKRAEEARLKAEQKYKIIFRASTDAIMMLDRKKFFDCNASALKMFRVKTVEEFCKFHPSELSPPKQPDGSDSKKAADKEIEKAYKTGSNLFSWVHRRRNGEDFFAEVLLTRMELEGRLVLQVTVRDITERRKSEIELKKLHLGFERSSQIMFMTDAKGKINYVNPAFEATYLIRKKEAIGKTPRILKSDKQSLPFYKNFWRRILDKEPLSIILVNKTRDGRLIDIRASVSPILDDSGQVIGFLAIQTNITEQRKIEMEIKRKVEQMEFMGRMNIKRHKKMLMMEKEIERLKKRLGESSKISF
ncbi:PAS domain S-box protein [Candidatus Peregrinibacteria bacterium]|nr:PAS domain S-box protein [Candidatus Peregrinibacteria bacterium]